MTEEMTRYYARRAAEYERVYTIPRWQGDLAILRTRIAAFCRGRRVFEVASGTGYWTQYAALTGTRVDGVDLNEETLALARARTYGPAPVTFRRADAYAPHAGPPRWDAGLAALWLSHVDRGRMAEFLEAFHSHLEPGAPVLVFDERPTAARKAPETRVDAAGNRYERRLTLDGEPFEIVKNFFEPRWLQEMVGGRDFTWEDLENFWLATYRRR